VLIEKDGRIGAFIVSVGGFLGVGEKHVAVPFQAVHATQRDGTPHPRRAITYPCIIGSSQRVGIGSDVACLVAGDTHVGHDVALHEAPLMLHPRDHIVRRVA
jgi:PRC-barrel domain